MPWFDQGVTALLGLPGSAVAEAWRRLTPDYSAGRRIAIKINLNNSFECDTTADDIAPSPSRSMR